MRHRGESEHHRTANAIGRDFRPQRAALFGEITIKDGKVEQQNFDSYQVVRMSQAPQVEVEIIKSAEPPEGIGEPGTPPIAPAVANAVFKLTGQRLRSLPLRLA